MGDSNHPNHTVPARKPHACPCRRNADTRHPDVLAARRRERTRIRSEQQRRRGRTAGEAARPTPANVRGQRTSGSRRGAQITLTAEEPEAASSRYVLIARKRLI
ncbi:MAG: hypothetical protein IRZ07_23940 [Microbispora sp.]|nr:hypothetical protein [Microbispora sp.]